MEYLVTAMIRVTDGESGYQIIPEEAKISGAKVLSFDQLFQTFQKRMGEKKKKFEYIVYVKVTQLHDDSPKTELPANK